MNLQEAYKTLAKLKTPELFEQYKTATDMTAFDDALFPIQSYQQELELQNKVNSGIMATMETRDQFGSGFIHKGQFPTEIKKTAMPGIMLCRYPSGESHLRRDFQKPKSQPKSILIDSSLETGKLIQVSRFQNIYNTRCLGVVSGTTGPELELQEIRDSEAQLFKRTSVDISGKTYVCYVPMTQIKTESETKYSAVVFSDRYKLVPIREYHKYPDMVGDLKIKNCIYDAKSRKPLPDSTEKRLFSGGSESAGSGSKSETNAEKMKKMHTTSLRELNAYMTIANQAYHCSIPDSILDSLGNYYTSANKKTGDFAHQDPDSLYKDFIFLYTQEFENKRRYVIQKIIAQKLAAKK